MYVFKIYLHFASKIKMHQALVTKLVARDQSLPSYNSNSIVYHAPHYVWSLASFTVLSLRTHLYLLAASKYASCIC